MTGKQLQTLRHEAGLSTAALSRLLGYSRRTVEEWEQGRRGIPPEVECVLLGICPTCRRAGEILAAREAASLIPQLRAHRARRDNAEVRKP
jgi:transcriptional regulator with XRE-family HTH domain